jgi:hypothetical protein
VLTLVRNHRSRTARSRERSPLNSQRSTASYGSFGIPRSPNLSPPPSYRTHPSYPRSRSPSPEPSLAYYIITNKETGRRSVWIFAIILLIVVAQATAFIFFYDLPSKIDQYNRTMARMREERGAMREEAKHLQTERIALKNEASQLGKERLALESATRKMEGEKDALESAIRRSELERSRFEQDRQRLKDEQQLLEDKRQLLKDEQQLLEDKRQLLEQAKEDLREEREKWEKAKEDRVPQGAFWDVVQPALECRAYGKREYWGMLQNIPGDWTDLNACMNMPVEIKGVTVRRPYRCGYAGDSPHIYGYWMVDWDQPDCKPWHRDFHDKVRGRATDGIP